MKEFKTIEEMKEYGKNFSKHQYEMVLLNNKKVILCGTDKAYEEAIWAGVNEVLEEMYEKFVTKEMQNEKDPYDCEITGKTSEIRDDIINWFEKLFDVKFIDVCEKFIF